MARRLAASSSNSIWSRAVAEEWAEDRRKDPEQLKDVVAVPSPELAASHPADIGAPEATAKLEAEPEI